ncbi:MAG: hypothetical protein ACXWRU_16550, partial [Pseudobdellovibrionaceae bacterium]
LRQASTIDTWPGHYLAGDIFHLEPMRTLQVHCLVKCIFQYRKWLSHYPEQYSLLHCMANTPGGHFLEQRNHQHYKQQGHLRQQYRLHVGLMRRHRGHFPARHISLIRRPLTRYLVECNLHLQDSRIIRYL